MPICPYAYMPINLYANMPICLHAYMVIGLYGYRPICRLERHHNSEQLIGFQRICVCGFAALALRKRILTAVVQCSLRFRGSLAFNIRIFAGVLYGTGIEIPICVYAHMPICLYANMPICLYAFMPTCLYAYRPICRLERHHNSEQPIGFQRIGFLCVSKVRWHSKFEFSLWFYKSRV